MPKPLLRDLLLVTAFKFAALAVLYLLFFSSAERSFDDVGAHIAGQKTISFNRGSH